MLKIEFLTTCHSISCHDSPPMPQCPTTDIFLSYIFTADHLIFDNQLVCTALGKTISPTPSIPYL